LFPDGTVCPCNPSTAKIKKPVANNNLGLVFIVAINGVYNCCFNKKTIHFTSVKKTDMYLKTMKPPKSLKEMEKRKEPITDYIISFSREFPVRKPYIHFF
jgi:hypothetical protein